MNKVYNQRRVVQNQRPVLVAPREGDPGRPEADAGVVAAPASPVRPPLSVVVGTVAFVATIVVVLAVVGIIAGALLALGMQMSAGLSGHDPIDLMAIDPGVIGLVVAGVLLVVVGVLAFWGLRKLVRGVWQGRRKRSWAAVVFLALMTANGISAVRAEGTIPIRVVGAVVPTVGLVAMLMPGAWRWRSRRRWRALDEAAEQERAQSEIVALPEDEALNPTVSR